MSSDPSAGAGRDLAEGLSEGINALAAVAAGADIAGTVAWIRGLANALGELSQSGMAASARYPDELQPELRAFAMRLESEGMTPGARAEAHLLLQYFVPQVHADATVNLSTLESAGRAILDVARQAGEDWFLFEREPGLRVHLADDQAARLVYAAKDAVANVLLERGPVPPAVTMVTRVGAIRRRDARVLRFLCSGEIVYVGDLSPESLGTYVALAAGGLDAGPGETLPVRWAGVSDAWLAWAEGALLERREAKTLHRGQPAFPFSAYDANLLHVLEAQPIDWDAIIGAEAMGLMRRGYRIEVDALVRPDRYHEGYVDRLREMIFGA